MNNDYTIIILSLLTVAFCIMAVLFFSLWWQNKNCPRAVDQCVDDLVQYKKHLAELKASSAGIPPCYQQDWSSVRAPNPNSSVDWIFPNYNPKSAKTVNPADQDLLEETLALKSTPAQCGNWCIYNPDKNVSFLWNQSGSPNLWKKVNGAQCGPLTNDLASVTYQLTRNVPAMSDKDYKPYFIQN